MTPFLFLIPFVVFLAAQATKLLFRRGVPQVQANYSNNRFLNWLPHHGGMPSAHTAFATSLVLTVAWTEGIASPVFVVAASLALIVIDDALRLRNYLGQYGKALNLLLKRLPSPSRPHVPHLAEQLGHRPSEVGVGIVVGILYSLPLLLLFAGIPSAP
jgi:hypothetical protein